MTSKNDFGKCSLFVLSKIKTWTLRFPAKENPNAEKVLFDRPIVLQYDVKAKYRLISGKLLGMKVFSPECLLNQPKDTRVCIRSVDYFVLCSRVFISRSYENRSQKTVNVYTEAVTHLKGQRDAIC